MKWIAASLIALGTFAFSAQALETKAKQAIMVDMTSGVVLFEKEADALMHPSSMSKLMTLYVAFKYLKDGSLALTDEFPVSEKAWRMQGSKSFMPVGGFVKVEDLVRGIIIQSGNDSCIVLAEGLTGSEENFVKEMNATAKSIGLMHSTFTNSTGWPDENHVMTARDLSLLAKHIIADFPEYYHYFSEREFTYHNITQPNRNVLLTRDIGVDGLKTGHTDAGGYGIAVSAKDSANRRLLVVVNGLGSEAERAEEAEKLVRAGWRDFRTKVIFKAGDVIEQASVLYGTSATVDLVAEKDVAVTVPTLDREKVKISITYDSPVPAPVKKGAKLGQLQIALPGAPPTIIPLIAGREVEKLGAFQRIIPALKQLLSNK